jgi:tRNA(fMet)-specific endonuclease VapC
MIYVPDTNAFSAYLSGRSASLTQRMVAAFNAGELRLSVMVMAELAFGAEKARTALGNAKFGRRLETLRKQMEVTPLGAEFPSHYANVRVGLEAVGLKIGDRDTIIAAHALAIDGILVTRNEAKFSRVKGLKVENWELC